MAATGNPVTQYMQPEQPYLYCSVCGRKDYRLNQAAIIPSGQAIGQSGITCMAYNSAPAKYPQQPCQGTMTLTTTTLSTLNNELVHDERDSS